MEHSNEWKITGEKTIERELKGAEYLINFTEEIQDGNYQLIFNVTLEGTISHEDLKKRLQPAYLKLRRKFPLLGVEYDMSGLVTFNALQTCEEAKEWVEEVTEILEANPNEIARDVAKRVAEQPLSTTNRMSKGYLVLGGKSHQSGLIIHSSHALTGHYGIQIMDNFAKNMVELDSEGGIEGHFEPEVCSELISRLPGSLEKAYYEKFMPTEKDIEEQKAFRQTLIEQEKKPRIGIPIPKYEDEEERESLTQNLLLIFDKQKSNQILQSIKQSGLSPTTAFYSSIICAIFSLYGKRDQKIEGCMLNFSTHASRFIPCEGQTGKPVVSMAIVPSSIWLDISDEELNKPLNKESLIKFANRIGERQRKTLNTPHAMSFATETVKMLKDGEPVGPQEENEISNAILTSQGLLQISEQHKKGKDLINILDYHCFGRNTDPTVCFAICTLRGTLRISSLFDEKFFKREEMVKLLNTSIDFLLSLQEVSRDAHL